MASKEERKYEVEIKNAEGTCKEELFTLMAQNGDITATKVKDLMNTEVSILGYAETHITTADKDFDIFYFDTAEYGLVSAGSQIFAESVKNYFGKCKSVFLKSIKTNKGSTYKAVPVLGGKKEVTTGTEDDLPF